ncbi:unnamed protein product [Cylindrotheca closterium]|uniref:Uncharacterized protein n=1 Tax=Cylindrotheca closterium TaxID=2856 RepID=A0AAD2FX52_9STRA|nr:unnamed protein product [Cylindrotheca closterium]
MKSLFLYNLTANEERLVAEIRQAMEWKESVNICSTNGMEVSLIVRNVLSELLVRISEVGNRFMTLSLGGSKFGCNLNHVVQLANELGILKKICFDDVNFIPSIVHGMCLNPNLLEISLCIASPNWRKSALISFCKALTNPQSRLEILRVRTWTHVDCFTRNQLDIPQVTQWDEGLDPILQALVGKNSIHYLEVQVHDLFSTEQKSILNQCLCHEDCQIATLDLRVQRSTTKDPSNANALSWIFPGMKKNTRLRHIHFCGWKLTAGHSKEIINALQSCRHIEGFKFDRSQLESNPSAFITALLKLDFLKSISSYSNGWKLSPPRRYDEFDISALLPAITGNNSLEALYLRDMNVSIESINELLRIIGEHCPHLNTLELINMSKLSTSGEDRFLEPLRCPYIEKVHLVGLPPFASKRRRGAQYEDRTAWFRRALVECPRLYSFGPGENYGLSRFLVDIDTNLLHSADFHKYGQLVVGKSNPPSLWTHVLHKIQCELDDPKRISSVIFALLAKGCIQSFIQKTDDYCCLR